MIAAGFGGVSYRRMTGGICAVHVGTRAERAEKAERAERAERAEA
jgi:hypothetical protein